MAGIRSFSFPTPRRAAICVRMRLEDAAAAPRTRPHAIANWLLLMAALVFLMVIVGGITRLTESGLSITEWKPVTGTLPPLSDAAWQAAFDAYKTIPQYAALNTGMTIDQFRVIYFWEYAHRLLARVVGLAFAVPMLWFAAQWAIPRGYGARLIALFALGGLQGAVGWWMVTSGLMAGTAVSHLRLAVHLLMALTIMGGLIWTALDLRALARDPRAVPARPTALPCAVIATLFVQIMLGAWTSGLRAGLVSSDWPLMNGRFFPEAINWRDPAILTVALDPRLVHFVHRWWAWLVVIAVIVMARRVRRAGQRPAAIAMHAALGTQIILGIATVLSAVALPLAALHQAVGALLVGAVVWGAHELSRGPRVTTPIRIKS
jgi:heme a synthase